MIEILQLEDSTRQTLTEMNSTVQKINYVSYEKKKSKGNKNKQKFQNYSNGSNSSSSRQNRLLQVLASSAIDARNPSPKDMKKCAKHSRLSVMHVASWGIIKLLAENQVSFHRKLILILILQEE